MNILRRIPYYGFFALLAYMPFHIFLSQWLSLATGGLEVWKVGKDVVLFGLVLFTICLIWFLQRGSRLFYVLVGIAVLYGLTHLALWAINPEIFTKSAVIGIVYNNRLPFLLLLGFGAYLLNGDKFVISSVVKFVLVLSTIVAFLGVLQYYLPKDLLTHFGYGLGRGTRPSFFIDDNPALPRVFSTLREPNALAAYLLVPVALLTTFLARARQKRRLLFGGLLLLHLLALFLTFSRSAWIAAVLVMAIVLWWNHQKMLIRTAKKYWPVMVMGVIVVMIGLFATRNVPFINSYFTHRTDEAVADLDSNDYHVLYIEEGLQGVTKNPLGHGPGTAGLASIQNPSGGLLTENYYLQIAYEVGVFGLVLFVALNVFVYSQLLKRKDFIGTVFIASFWGYVLMNMLLHTWSNEAVATQWWLLAGMAIAATPFGRSASTKKSEVS